MNQRRNELDSRILDRRRFCSVAGAGSSGHPGQFADLRAGGYRQFTRSSDANWKRRVDSISVVPGWGHLPAGTSFGGTHGGIATDKAGHVYVSTQSETGVLVYSPDGVLLKTIANEYPEVHSIVYAQENGEEYLYTTVQKGTPKENWLFVKMKTDGTVVQKITAPPEAGFKTPNEWRLTAAVPAPDGSIFIANGYGDSRLFRFDKNGEYKTSYSGKGKAEGLLDCSHGLAVDTRFEQPLLLVCDRENRRLCHFDFDGKFVRTVTQHLRRPCQISFHGDFAVISELEGRVTILDRDNTPVAFLGDNPRKVAMGKLQAPAWRDCPSLLQRRPWMPHRRGCQHLCLRLEPDGPRHEACSDGS